MVERAKATGVRWYREPWVWLVIAIPASAVLMGAVLLVLAGRGYDGIVIDDYYKRGLQINRSLERDRAAAAHGLVGQLVVGAGAPVSLELSGRGGFSSPPRLTLELMHATRGGVDRTLELRQDGPDRYVGERATLPPGAWNVQLAAPGWRLVGRLTVPGSTSVRLAPG